MSSLQMAPRVVPGRLRRHYTRQRRSELGMMLLVAIIVSFAYILAAVGQFSSMPAHILPVLVAILVLPLVVHVANVVIDGLIDSPGTRALPMAQKRPDIIMNPVKIAEAFYYLHTQDRSCWTHELQLTPFPTKPSY